MATFSENLVAFRKKAGISQDKLAEQLHITRQAVSKWESGSSMPDVEMLSKLCQVLGITPNQLLGYEMEQSDAHAKSSEKRSSLLLILSCVLMLSLFFGGLAMLIINLCNGRVIHPQVTVLGFGIMCSGVMGYLGILIWQYLGLKRKQN